MMPFDLDGVATSAWNHFVFFIDRLIIAVSADPLPFVARRS